MDSDSRTIAPVISQNGVSAKDKSEFGLGDITQSLFFSPKKLKENGLVWGVGPVLLLPTATNDLLGEGKWATGPSVILLKLKGPWVFGALINQMWSFAGRGEDEINASFFQPWITYSTASGVSYSIEAENTQSWNNDIFTGYVSILYAKVIEAKKQMMQLEIGPKFYYGNNAMNPKWGIRATVYLLYPKK